VTKPILIVLLALGLAGAAAAAEAEKAAKPAKQETAAKPEKKSESAEAETRQTPFGPAKVLPPDPNPAPSRNLADDPFVSAEEKGELVIFRRKTPFGAQVWKKKKSELTAAEQAILARGPQPEEQQPAAKPKAASKKRAPKSKASPKQ
jgi:hypothetical protein